MDRDTSPFLSSLFIEEEGNQPAGRSHDNLAREGVQTRQFGLGHILNGLGAPNVANGV